MNDFEDADDGCDEIANVSNRQTPDEAFEASGGQLSRYNKTGPGSPVKGQPIRKLADLRWTDHLDPNEARDVIRLAKTGDPSAIDAPGQELSKDLIGIAGQTKYNGPAFEDRLSAGWRGFWRRWPATICSPTTVSTPMP